MTGIYTVQSVFNGLKDTFHQYLEAQYHIWDESLIRERQRLFSSSGTTFQIPSLEATPFYVPGSSFSDLDIPAPARAILQAAAAEPSTGIFSTPYLHQAQALEAVLTGNNDVIVATGTGSGKTESFLMPILGSLALEAAERPESWGLSGMRALLLYPMNALVNDQVSRLRRLLGNRTLAAILRRGRPHNATFGMYTSRTPYPGTSTPAKDRDRIGRLVARLFGGISPQARALLESEGKWPCKDMDEFTANGFQTGVGDSEMFSRHEMQTRCPDVLVTNYSMLEYMMLRPIERSLFDQTRQWLDSDRRNLLTVVVDEAHMYRGSGGAEVAYLLRRLHGRLGVPRDRIRYILTSASLGTGPEAERKIKQFAGDLTGLGARQPPFVLIRGQKEQKADASPGSSPLADAFATFHVEALQTASVEVGPAFTALADLCRRLQTPLLDAVSDVNELRGAVHRLLTGLPVAALLANRITSAPEPLESLARELFPGAANALSATEALLALVTFGRESHTGRVFAPVRAHLFFKGLPGLYSCVNQGCEHRVSSERSLLGRMYSAPQLRCACSSRVFELLTHRDCGAAFIRGYVNGEHGEFLWHEPSSGLWQDAGLLEVHLLAEPGRVGARGGAVRGSRAWLHKTSGRLFPERPAQASEEDFLELIRPDALVADRGRVYLTFQNECPVCLRTWQGASKIMDLATKGEASFSHLVRQQVALQPPTREKTERFPNAGRKSLIFSDGRQKAARLARDIPREIEKDVFRQIFLLAATRLRDVRGEATLGLPMYIAFLDAVHHVGLQLFDGDDRHALKQHVREYVEWHETDLRGALMDLRPTPPARYSEHLLRQLGSRFYSVSALTLAYLRPTNAAMRGLGEALQPLSDQALAIAVEWVQGMAEKFAVDLDIRHGIRQIAAGYSMSVPNARGFSARQRDLLVSRGFDASALEGALQRALCSTDPQGRFFLNPTRVRIEVALDLPWAQCNACSTTSPLAWWGACPNCLSGQTALVQGGESPYLRARKGFWRDPVAQVLSGRAQPIELTVEEHTAQLSHRDLSEPSSTTEEFERRFRDILIRDDDTPVDVLSSTTTMEVGIDIGSLVAVALRNVPPLRQNYQQRAGRAGRRGASVSSVITFAQNSPHDAHYFRNPHEIISGEPTLPTIDIQNPKIIARHVRAQLVEAFFRDIGAGGGVTGNIFATLGETWTFFSGEGRLTLAGFTEWLRSPSAHQACEKIRAWIPPEASIEPQMVAESFVQGMERDRPASEEQIDQANEFLIEFLFAKGYLPAYAFPRDLCALQIEGDPPTEGFRRVPVLQRPQQALSIALSEYAPGRLVVVDKKTYRIGSVTAAGGSSIVNRAERLFAGQRAYVHCAACFYTAGFADPQLAGGACPVCAANSLRAVTVIQPEIVFPDGGQEVDEFDDEQVFSEVTSAQLPLAESDTPIQWRQQFVRGRLAAIPDQAMVMVNSGQDSPQGATGFLVCSHCGKAALNGLPLGPHRRDYRVQPVRGNARPPSTCNGEFRQVYLGYSFSSDVLLFRLPVGQYLRYDPVERRLRQPLADALQSLCEALVLAISRELDIDLREVSAGYRFVRTDNDYWADIFIYDTLAGGAGYAVLAGASFAAIVDRALLIVSNCDCGSSCDKCLRHYGNRFHHANLDRFLAGDLIRFVRDGTVPPDMSVQQQQEALLPLLSLLELAGWAVERRANQSPVARYGTRAVNLRVVHSLSRTETESIPRPEAAVFTPYELQRDLPGSYAEIA